MKKVKPKKKYPHCDFRRACKNKAYAEVFPSMLGGKHKNRGWNYLCRKHYYQEQKLYPWKIPAYIIK